MNTTLFLTDIHSLVVYFVCRNVVFAPSSHNSYAGSVFPGLQDSLYELDRAVDEADKAQKAETVKQQLSVVSLWIEVAAASLLEHITW